MSQKPKPWYYDWENMTCTNCGQGTFKRDETIGKYNDAGLLVWAKCVKCEATGILIVSDFVKGHALEFPKEIS